MNKDTIIVVGGVFLLCMLAPTLVQVFAFIAEYTSLILALGIALIGLFFIVKRLRRV